MSKSVTLLPRLDRLELESPDASGRRSTLTVLFTTALIGVATGSLAIHAAGVPKKVWAFGFLAFMVAMAALLSRRPKLVFLFAWAFSLTYNRAFFSLDGIFSDSGSQGPYWILADVFLATLFGMWVYELVLSKRLATPQGRRLWPWFLPFAAACGISILGASRPDWVLFELLRVVKVGLVLLYIRFNFGKREWWTCVAAIGLAVITQSILGILEVATGQTGVLWLIGLKDGHGVIPDAFRPERFYGPRRATGTMNHPPHLASYFVLCVPLFLALGLTLRRKAHRLLALGTALIGLAGLACTLSRGPNVLMLLQTTTLVLGLISLRLATVQRALGLAALGVCCVAAASMPFTDLIARRATGDFEQSTAFRAKDYRVASRMLAEQPFLGVGLNNYRVRLLKYDPGIAWAVANDDLATKQDKVRFVIGPMNVFLLFLAETGILGFVAFLLLLTGVIVTGIRAVLKTDGGWRAAHFGLLIGIVGLLGEQLIDNSLWVDPLLYTFTLMVGLLNTGTTLADQEVRRTSAEWGGVDVRLPHPVR